MAKDVLWRRVDRPGMEVARLVEAGDGWRVEGMVTVGHEGTPCGLRYVVVCDSLWRTRSARVAGWIGGREVDVRIEVDVEAGRWLRDGEAQPAVAGCVDVDLGFSPSTNLLPIRRLGLAVGEEAPVEAAWLPFPGLELERLPQTYRRLGEDRYRYASRGGAFVAELEVDADGFVIRYPGLWERVDA